MITEPPGDRPASTEPAAKLKPKEHGAYAILAIPAITALIVTGPTVPGVCIIVASVAGFMAHEPMLVRLGHRGPRARRATPAATNRLCGLLAVTLVCGTIAFALGSVNVRVALVGCGTVAAASFALAIAGRHRSLGGQLWGIVALSAPCVPILLAGGIGLAKTAESWMTWWIGFTATTMAVRGVIAFQKRQSRSIHWSAITILSLLVGALTMIQIRLPVTTLPMLAMSWYLTIAPPAARHLKRVGWTLVIGTVATAGWMAIEL